MHLREIALELVYSWIIPISVVFLTLGLLSLVTGCSTMQDTSRSLDLAVRGNYAVGAGAQTRNQNPQGGTDEKSESTPIEPSR